MDVTCARYRSEFSRFYYPAKKATNKTIVVAHGYQSVYYTMAPYIRMFHEQGYNVSPRRSW